jgi:hypothetical protein
MLFAPQWARHAVWRLAVLVVKFRRYDNLICWWWRESELALGFEPPLVLFVCQDDEQRETFIDVADREPTGHLWQPSDDASDHDYAARARILFASEVDMHAGEPIAWRPAQFPRGHPDHGEGDGPRGVRLPGEALVAGPTARAA